jgi:hypothetical protein
MNRRRRSLVLTNEASRHPFRANLPPKIVEPARRSGRRLFGLSARDVRDFAAAFVATFVVVSAFIA